MTEPTALTFEQGYTRLQTISERVASEEVPVAEMCELFAEGKGLQKSLTEYLDEQKSRVEAIERGEGIRAFRIASAPGGEAGAPQPGASGETFTPPPPTSPSDVGDFAAPPSPPVRPPADDERPF